MPVIEEEVALPEEPPLKQAKTQDGQVVGRDAQDGPVPQPKPGEYVMAPLMYQGLGVPTGLVATGKVKSVRDASGSDSPHIGCDYTPHNVKVINARGLGMDWQQNGFTLVEDKREHVDYMDHDQVLKDYYPEVCELVKRVTGAREVYAFDHNVRSKAQNDAGAQIKGGNAVQGPALVVHGDYTVTSSCRRVRDLAKPPKLNDTLRQVLGDKPLLDPTTVEEKLKGRWALMNVWRNIRANPVQKLPLALCDSRSVPLKDLVTFEIHYADRIGENYFCVLSDDHKWYYFPEITRDEAVLLKCWDSYGADFAEHPAGPAPGTIPASDRVPSTFTFHTAFEDPSSLPDAEDRESIEVRTVVFF